MPATKTGNPKLSALLALHDIDGDPRAFKWIIKAMRECKGNIDAAAAGLRVTRQTFYDWFRKYPELRTAHNAILYNRREAVKRGEA